MKKLAQVIGFQAKENVSGIFIKKYADGYFIEIDFEKQTFFFGGKIKVGGKETQNITKPEDWVVLECVDKLLSKGYKPENISLEKVYPAGHGFSGRLDICVTRQDSSEYLLIECKTFGKEFDKEFNKLKNNGGQLFTYFKFSNKADIILLYASELRGNEIVYKNEIVKIEEDYRTGDVKDFYEKWNKLTKDNGVFESWVKPYNFESKALTINDLEEIRQEDSSFIFNRFLEILRHNVVSDKGNAFNRIFTLFLCKIYDEKTNEGSDNELGFQWFESPFTYDGIYYEKDNHKSFQIRLTDLYKNGMREFLEKKVTDLSDNEFNSKFHYLTEEQRAPILNEFKKIRLEKNNEFAIKDVYDEQSFYDNAVVVKEIVELLQNFKIRYTKKQQYLSDFFELLLTTGLKQESGQFFTPVPVAQFVIKSLPLDTIIEEKLQKGERNEYLPYIMDYAAGSGHFLTETMHEAQRIIDKSDFKNLKADVNRFIKQAKEFHFDWAFDYVYGIEKDYRLVKVGKVGCYLHGDGLANVIHSDGLARFSHDDYKGKLKYQDKDFPKENKQFDVIVSNPPYSVSAFRNNASKYYNGNEFDLYEKLTDNSSEIECLFIERTKQLLKDGGVAGIILPSSILSNTGIYSKSREQILQYFDIVGITELGSNTFMATGTNTVTLFLRRRNNYDCEKIKSYVTRFTTDFIDNTVQLNDKTKPIERPVTKYVNHVWEGISFEDYVSLLKKTPSKAINEHEIYNEYCKKSKSYSLIKFLEKEIESPKNIEICEKLIEKKEKAEKEFWQSILELEHEKLYYFIIAFSQKVILVKSGEKDAEKRFLGYEFSNRRGSEGIHPIQRGKNIEDCTQLFDADVFDNPEKASTYIYKAFAGDYDFEIDEAMQNNVSRHDLVDMLTFDRVDFEKNISLSVKKKIKIESKWELKKLGEVCEIFAGGDVPKERWSKIENQEFKIPIYSNGIENDGLYGFTDKPRVFEKCITISARGTIGFTKQRLSPFYPIVRLLVLIPNKDSAIVKYLEVISNEIEFEQYAVGTPQLTVPQVSQYKIPLPPLNIQQKIVSEIEFFEAKEKKAKEEVEKLKIKANEIFNKIEASQKVSLEDISENLDSLRKPVTKGYREKGEIPYYGASGIVDYVSDYILDDFVLLISEDGANLKARTSPIAFTASGKIWVNNHAHILKFKEKATHKLVEIYINKTDISEYITGQAQPKLNQQNLNNIKIPLPPFSEQQKIVSEIEKIEAKIKFLETEIAAIPKQKEEVLKTYL